MRFGITRFRIVTRAYLLCATMIAACLGFSETSFGQSDEAVGNAVGNLIVGIFNNAQASSVRDSWRKLDPAIQICLVQAYRLHPADFAQQGIKATDNRIVPLIRDCERRNVDLLAGMSVSQRDGFNQNALIIANQEAEAMKVQAQHAGTQLFAQTFRDGLVVAKEAIDEAARRKEQERINAENERRRLAYEAQLAEQRRIYEEQKKAEEDRIKALQPPAPPQAPVVEAPPQRPVEVAKVEDPPPAPPVQGTLPPPAQPDPVAVPTPPQATPPPAPSVSANGSFTFFEHRADDGTVMTVSVYQNGQLITTAPQQSVAGGYGYQAGISGSYQVPGGSVATNVQTTPESRSPISSMPQKLAEAEPVIDTRPSRPPGASPADNQSFNGGLVGNAPTANSNNPGTSSGSNYTFVPTGPNMVQIYLNGQHVSGGTPQYAAQFGYTGPGSNAPPSDYNRQNPPPQQVASVQPSPIQQTSPTPYTPPRTGSPPGGNTTPGQNSTAPPKLDLPDDGQVRAQNPGTQTAPSPPLSSFLPSTDTPPPSFKIANSTPSEIQVTPEQLAALNKLHTGLGVAGMVPGPVGSIASGVDGAVYLTQGDLKNAGISFVGVVPVVGLIKGGRIVKLIADEGGEFARGEKIIGDLPPSTPTGRSGYPLVVPKGTNVPTIVNGTEYSGHAIDEMQSDGITPMVVQNAIRVGKKIVGKEPGTTAFYDAINNITVIVANAGGKVVTVSRGFIEQ